MEKTKIPLSNAIPIAERVRDLLAPHCYNIAIAGSIRRKAPMVGDIEIVAIPKPYSIGLFADGIVPIVNQWHKIKGELPCKYTQRILPEGIKLDLFFADPTNWGYILAIRTGSVDFSKRLAYRWKIKGYVGNDGYLTANGRIRPVPDEETLFKLLGMDYVEPEDRKIVIAQVAC